MIPRFSSVLAEHIDSNSLPNNPAGIAFSLLEDVIERKSPELLNYIELPSIKRVRRVTGYEKIVDQLCEKSSLDIAYWVSSLYSLLLTNNVRSNYGLFFTPPLLSRAIISQVERSYDDDLTSARILDPCSGGGAFLVPIVQLLMKRMKDRRYRILTRLERIQNNLDGIDVNSDLNRLTRIFIINELSQEIKKTGFLPNLNVKTGDTLSHNICRSSYDIVIGNPPFRKLTAVERYKYGDRYCVTSNGGSNLYGMFIQKCLELVRPGGVVSLIVPTSMFAGSNFRKLRKWIRSDATVLSIHCMNHRGGIFIDVQQETAILTLRRYNDGQRNVKNKATKIINLDNPKKT